jgi:hypothetical protein
MEIKICDQNLIFRFDFNFKNCFFVGKISNQINSVIDILYYKSSLMNSWKMSY